MKQDFVILPRDLVELALASLESEFGKHSKSASDIRTALEQPQDHVPDAGNMAPTGWKLVPVEPTDDMLGAGLRHVDGMTSMPSAYRDMLAAAPQPPTVEKTSAVEQPRGGQEPDWQDMYQKEKRRAEMWVAKYEKDIGKLEVAVPVAEQQQGEQAPSPTAGMNIAQRILHVGGRNNAAGYVEFGSIQAVEALVRQVLRDLPQPKRELLTDDELDKLCPQFEDPMRREMWKLGFKVAHNIKD